MAQTVKFGTFNIENLFMRYRLLDKQRGAKKGKALSYDDFTQGGNINMLGWSVEDYSPVSKPLRTLSGRVILENKPDILAVQEVENMEALIQFNRKYLKKEYPYMMVIDGNDIRQIDVGLLSKYEIGSVRTHRFEPEGSAPQDRTFSRDCLEAEILLPSNKSITVLVNHFKSKIGGGEEKRRRQAARVAEILTERFGKALKGNFIVAGDFNADADEAELTPLLAMAGLDNVVARLPKEERWTHCYGKQAEQFDYVLISPDLSKKNAKTVPYIERRGLGTEAHFYTGDRFDPKEKEGASDHCAVFMELTL